MTHRESWLVKESSNSRPQNVTLHTENHRDNGQEVVSSVWGKSLEPERLDIDSGNSWPILKGEK